MRKKTFTKSVLIATSAIISVGLSLLMLPQSVANENKVIVGTTNANWEFLFVNKTNNVFLTDTKYELAFNYYLRTSPVFRTSDSRHRGCEFNPSYVSALNDPESGMTRPIIWHSTLSVEITNRYGAIKLFDRYDKEDPYSVKLEMWIDNNGLARPDGLEDARPHFFAPTEGVVSRPNLLIEFPEPGEYYLDFSIETGQHQKPVRTGPPSSCYSWTSYQIVENSSAQKFFVKVEDKAQYDAKQKAKIKSKKKKIVCVKGKSKLEIIGTKPICPAGYKRK